MIGVWGVGGRERVGGLVVVVEGWCLWEIDSSILSVMCGFWDFEDRIDRFDRFEESVEFTPEKISWSFMALV